MGLCVILYYYYIAMIDPTRLASIAETQPFSQRRPWTT